MRIEKRGRITTSDDGGKTWTVRSEQKIVGRIVRSIDALYLVGGWGGELAVMRSNDNGSTWESPVKVGFKGGWGCQNNVFYDGRNAYMVFSTQHKPIYKDIWGICGLGYCLFNADLSADLRKHEAWKKSDCVSMLSLFKSEMEGNEFPWDYFGVPFFTQIYPKSNTLARNPWRGFHPMGMLEPNVVRINDKNHYWYDPAGKTLHIISRLHFGGTGYVCLLKLVEKDGENMELLCENAPSGKKFLFFPFPGGQMLFNIQYDLKTKLFWMLGTQSVDSMTHAEKLPADRFDLPNNESRRLVLHYSKNLVDWCFAGLVAVGATNKEARHYAAMNIDGDDLVIMSRSGDADAKSAHDGNLTTFHRVKNFRNLVY